MSTSHMNPIRNYVSLCPSSSSSLSTSHVSSSSTFNSLQIYCSKTSELSLLYPSTLWFGQVCGQFCLFKCFHLLICVIRLPAMRTSVNSIEFQCYFVVLLNGCLVQPVKYEGFCTKSSTKSESEESCLQFLGNAYVFF